MSISNVAIVGGGIAGLITAVALSQRYPAMNIDVYEAATAFGEIGLGIGMWPRTWEVLERLGLEEEFDAIVCGRRDGPNDGNTVEVRKSNQKAEGETLASIKRSVARMTTLHRQDLQRVLLEIIKKDLNCRCHVAHRLVRYAESQEGVDLLFENGVTARSELLIGADGIKSVVRSQMLPGNDPVYFGTYAYRAVIPVEKLNPGHSSLKTSVVYCGKNKHLVAYLISGGTLMNAAAFINEPDTAKATARDEPGFDFQKEIGPIFSGWEEDVQTLLKNMENPIKFPLFELKPLDTFISAQRRVVLIGDAAHAMLPHLGAGAGQAIEDGYTLATLLDRPYQDALEAFDRIRRPWTNSLLRSSQDQAHYYDMNAPEFEGVQDGEIDMASELKELMKETTSRWSWGWSHVPTVQDI